MIVEIKMPRFGLSMVEGKIGSLNVKEGDMVKKGDELIEVETDKLVNTVEAPEDGRVGKILCEVGETLDINALLMILADEDEDLSGYESGVVVEEIATPEEASISEVKEEKPAVEGELKITPRAKKVAEDKNIDYSNIEGTGLLGAITVGDLRKAYEAGETVEVKETVSVEPAVASTQVLPEMDPVKVPEGTEIVKLPRMQQVISENMYQSLQSTAQVTVATEADVTPLVKTYNEIKGKYTNAGIKLSYTSMIIKALAMALEDHPNMKNIMVDNEHIAKMENINISVAIDIPDGLIVPVIKDANLKDLRTISMELEDLARRAQTGELTGDEMSGGIITVTNLGMFGATYSTPVLNRPESSILGVGAIIEKVLAKDGQFYVGHALNLSLTHDHRIINGAPAARFLQDLVFKLQDFRWL